MQIFESQIMRHISLIQKQNASFVISQRKATCEIQTKSTQTTFIG